MDEHPTSALHYGHLGRAVYLPETQAWTFTRSLARSTPLSYTGVTKTTVPSSLVPNEAQVSIRSQGAERRRIQSAFPDLAGCCPSVVSDAFSKLVATTTDSYDPSISATFDLGHAVDHQNDESSSRAIPIAVSVAGDRGNSILLSRLVDGVMELKREDLAMRVPSISGSDVTLWSKNGAPIRQVRFARTVEGKATWMAARLPDSTIVFRPLYHRQAVPVHIHDGFPAIDAITRQNARLDANPVVEISTAHTGGFAHADVTFNPWYPRQFAVVDDRGNWSIWEISGRHRRGMANMTAARINSGSLPWPDYNHRPDPPRHDGWGSIEWIGDISTLLVSDRQCVMLYRIEGDQVRLNMVEIGMTRKSEWVLAVQRSSHNDSHFFVLTTSRILWFDISAEAGPSDEDEPRQPLQPRLAWRHFRDPEDTTLHLADLLANGELYIVLYSRLNGLVQAFPCPISTAEEETEMVSVPDPFILDVPTTVDGPQASSVLESYTMHYSTFVFKEVAHSPAPVGRAHYNRDLMLIKLFWADSQLAVHESLFTSPKKRSDEEDIQSERTVLRIKKRKAGTLKNPRALDEDHFVVDDWDESVTTTDMRPHHLIPQTSVDDLPWTLDFGPVYALVTGESTAIMNHANLEKPTERTLDQLLEHMQSSLHEPLSDRHMSETMLEINGSSPLMDDIDQGAHDLDRLVSALVLQAPDPQAEDHFMVLPLRFPGVFYGMPTVSSEQESHLDLVETYDRLVHDFISGLPRDIPARTRIFKEKLARKIAADLLLARLVRLSDVPHKKETAPAERQVNAEQEEGGAVIPNQDFSSQGAMAAPRVSSSQPDDSSYEPQQGKVAGHPSAVAETRHSDDGPAPVFSTLSTFTRFDVPSSMRRNVATLLSHWQPGTDPSGYKWQGTTQILEEEEAQRASRATTPKQRLRKKRSQPNAAANALAQPPTSSAVPAVRTWGSQPEGEPAPQLQLQSSQPTIVDEMPMTQIERGQFGGREGIAKSSKSKKKKKRAAGF